MKLLYGVVLLVNYLEPYTIIICVLLQVYPRTISFCEQNETLWRVGVLAYEWAPQFHPGSERMLFPAAGWIVITNVRFFVLQRLEPPPEIAGPVTTGPASVDNDGKLATIGA